MICLLTKFNEWFIDKLGILGLLSYTTIKKTFTFKTVNVIKITVLFIYHDLYSELNCVWWKKYAEVLIRHACERDLIWK